MFILLLFSLILFLINNLFKYDMCITTREDATTMLPEEHVQNVVEAWAYYLNHASRKMKRK